MKWIKIVFILFFTALVYCANAQVYFIVDFIGNKTSGCDSLTVKFTDKTAASNLTAWLWDFGDGETSTLQNPTHLYDTAGIYTVKLTVTRTIGSTVQVQSKTKSNFIKIFDTPTADFTVVDSLFNTSFTLLFNSTTHLDTAGFTYKWDFGNNDTASFSSTIFTFAKADSFPVWLIVTDNNGCKDSTQKTVSVTDRFLLPNCFTPNGDGLNDEFVITTSGAVEFEFKVFNRWGDLMFFTSARGISWDGRNAAGIELNPGVYYYILKPKNGGSVYKGFLHLSR